jgi:hypothetical protein
MKLNALLKDLLQNGVLGTAVADIHVVEWQKQGLPHGHILIILCSQDKPRDSNDYDPIVCAELPDKSTHPRALQHCDISHVAWPLWGFTSFM